MSCSICWELFTDILGQPMSPEMLVNDYQHMLCNISGERKPKLQKSEILHYWYQFIKEVNSGEWWGGGTRFSTYIGTFWMNECTTEARDWTVLTALKLTSFLSQSPSSWQLSTRSNFKSNSNPSNRSWSSRIRSEFESSCIRDSSSCAETNYRTGYTNCTIYMQWRLHCSVLPI